MTHSCSIMNKNCPDVVNKFFKSDTFFKQFTNINMMIDELWMLRKEHPAQLQEWRVKHRQIFQLRSKLLKFTKELFGRMWVMDLVGRAENQRVRVWPLTAQIN